MERGVSFFGVVSVQILGPVSIAVLIAALLGCVILSMYRRKQRKIYDETTKTLAHMRFESMDEITVRRQSNDEDAIRRMDEEERMVQTFTMMLKENKRM